MPPSLRYVLLAVRSVPAAARFYAEGLGLPLRVMTDRWAELGEGEAATLALKAADGEAFCSVGYSPMLTFTVPDLQAVLGRALPLGAHMDGGVQYTPQGRVAALRAPDGHMISLVEEEPA